MAQQTSRMYGVKVKEKVNYYEFGDAGTGKQITLSYENKVWTVKAGGKQDPSVDVSWFRDGNEYHKGDTIVTFNDGDEVTYHIMEQDRSETPYINLMYDIFGNMAMNVEYGNKDVYYRIVPGTKQYSCKVYEFVNGIIHSSKEFTSEDIVNYKKIYKDLKANPLYPVYNMLFDWHGMNPESGYPQMSFEAISNSNYIKYNGNTKNKGVTINVWQAVGFLGFEVTDETNKHQAKKLSKEDSPDVKLIKRHGGLTVQEATKNNKTIYSDVMYDHKDAYYNGHYHDAMYLVYDNPNVDGCWRKKFNSIALTYADPYWFLMTTAGGVEYGGRTYEAQKLIRTWKPETSVNMTLKETISRRKAIPDNENYDKFIYHVVEEEGSDAVFVYYNQIVTVEDEEGIHDEQVTIDSVGFTSSQAPVTYKNIAFKIKNGSWTIFSGNQYITYEGKEAKTNQALKSFPISGAINIEIGDNSDKKGAAADKFVYDIEEIGGNDSITVKFQQVVNKRDPEGHSHKTYIDLDQRTFASGDSPVTFRNIQFKANSGKWTIYSKCGYIKYNGRMYPNNRSILSFAISEAIHIEIADESNIYEVKEQRIYNIKTPNSEVTVGYSIITSEMTRALKLVKMSGDKEEPWITVNFYDAMYKPYVYDDISVRYDAKVTKWELYSNSDDLYLNGTNYKLGSKIGESWSYYTFVKLTGITVVHTNNEALQTSVQIIKDGKVVKNVDIDEDIGWYDPEDLDFHLGYSYAKGLWVFRAIHNCWVGGINYSTGSVIKSFKTRLNVDQFTMMFRHYDDEEHPDIPTNVLYYITTSVDPFSGVTTVDVNCPGHGSNSYSDKDTSKEADKAYTFTKQDAKSMYGYIWKRFGGPTPPPGPRDYDWDIFAVKLRSDSNGWKFVIAVDTTFGSRYAKKLYQTNEYFYLNDLKGAYNYDTGDVGYLSSNYDNNSIGNNMVEIVAFGNGKNVTIRRITPFSLGNAAYVDQGSNHLEIFSYSPIYGTWPNISGVTIRKQIYDKYLSEIILDTSKDYMFGEERIGMQVNATCLYLGKIYFRGAPNWSEWENIYFYGFVVDKETGAVERLLQGISVGSKTEIAHELFELLSPIEKEVFTNNETTFRNSYVSIGISMIIDHEMVIKVGCEAYANTASYGPVSMVHLKYYKVDIVTGSMSFLSELHGNTTKPPYDAYSTQNYKCKDLHLYVPTNSNTSIIGINGMDIYKASETSIDGVINAEKVNTVDVTDTARLWRLDTNEYEEFSLYDLVTGVYRALQTLPYSTISSRYKKYSSGLVFTIETDKQGGYSYDKWVICITDPSFNNLSTSFCFLASSLYYSSEIDEHSYRPDPQLQT